MDRIHGFLFVTLTPAGSLDPSIAIAGSRAGGLGLLNLELTDDVDGALAALRHLAAHGGSELGVLLDGRARDLLSSVLAAAVPGLGTVALTATALDDLAASIEQIHASKLRAAVVATDLASALAAEAAHADAVIAKGNEAGGWVGDETSFILLQRLVGRVQLPIWVHGGVGLRSAAACYVGGAAGVVLDSQLLLTRDAALPPTLAERLAALDGSETACFGTPLGRGFRTYARPGLAPVDALRDAERLALLDVGPADDRIASWERSVRSLVGWDRPEAALLALGQDAAFASELGHRFETVGGVLDGIAEAIREHCAAAQETAPLGEGAPLASSHGTRYPIVQGPMTRVSDRPEFAAAVAEGGALPFLALALMRAPEVDTVLRETQDLLGDRPWGVGILGFVPPELRTEQLEVIRRYRPKYALIAGGRPDQAHMLEEEGIHTYLHVPSPGLLEIFLRDGARRFVFEGRECGGHVGPRTSFVLWDSMIGVLRAHLERGGDPAEYHVLFAGGVHDDRSAAMVAAIAGPLAARGVRVGVLLGTAYLFTEEAVQAGAIVDGFQQAAVACDRTVLLESGPGHATRCAPSAYVDDFETAKRELLQSGASSEEIRRQLEELNIGRLRIASKGVDRVAQADPAAARQLAPVPIDEQQARGMFMIGQVAVLHDQIGTIADLHRTVSLGSVTRLEATPVPTPPEEEAPPPAAVAIVGIGSIVPGAADLATFWANIVNKVDAVTEVPPHRWDWREYFDPDRATPDRIYSRWGGFIDDVPFDPVDFGMPPSSLSSIEPFQLLALLVTRAALRDAGYGDRPFPRERTSVILGAGGGGADLTAGYMFRSSLPAMFGENADTLTDRLGSAVPVWTEDSFAGILMNVSAGRIANRFDFGGTNYTVDAACASSLAAIYLGVRDLEARTSDVVVVGGVDAIQNPFAYLCFSKTQALSPTGRCRPFDAKADGIAISEGFAAVVLKRLEDAERDGDRIYAVIRGVGSASDGRDRSLTAPRPEGQIRALRRAYAQARFSPATVGLIEAHGTGTVAGDQAEVAALTGMFAQAGAARESCAIGSVKSMIGHTKATAGVAGLTKAALALHNRVLPPTIGVSEPNPRANFPAGPFYVNTEARPWLQGDETSPRRAGVSAFGFGGTDFHVALEEYTRDYRRDGRVGLDVWPAELFVWRAGSGSAIKSALDELIGSLRRGAQPNLADLAYTLARQASGAATGGPSLAIVATSRDDLLDKLTSARAVVDGTASQHLPTGVHFVAEPLVGSGKVAFLFPGQGSQVVNMARDLAVVFPRVRECFERADQVLAGRFDQPLSRYIFPPPCFTPEDAKRQQSALTETNIAQPALGATDTALLNLLRSLGVEPDMAAGHSYGEFVALHAAGCFDEDTLLHLSEARGRFMREGAGADSGTMAAVEASSEVLQPLLTDPGLTLANMNAPDQTVISGARASVERAIAWCEEQGLRARPLPVACAFHSPLVAPAQRRLIDELRQASISPPRFPVFSNTVAGPYPDDPAAIIDLLGEHLARPVQFVREIEAMYEAGARLFVEVGPRTVLSGLTDRILTDRPHLCVSTDQPGRSGLLQLLHALAALLTEGAPVALDEIFRGRTVRDLDLSGLESPEARFTRTTWLVNGGHARPVGRAADEHLSALPLHVQVGTTPAQVGTTPAPSAARPPVGADMSTPPRHPSSADAVEVMDRFQQVMRQFLDTQRAVMLTYMGTPGFAASGPAPLAVETNGARALHSGGAPPLPPLPEAPPTNQPATNGANAAGPVRHPPMAPVHAAPIPAQAPPPAAPPAANGHAYAPPAEALSREQLTDRLLKIVSDRTGYPTEMLSLDADLEADLGIDSIKRVEISSSALQQLPPTDRRPDMERLTSSRTLRQVVDTLEVLFAPALAGAGAGETRSPFEFEVGQLPRIGRFLVRAVPASSINRTTGLANGIVAIVDDGGGVGAAVAALLGHRGVRSVRLVRGPAEDAACVALGDIAGPDDAHRLVEEIHRTHGHICALVHLTALEPGADEIGLEPALWRDRVQRGVRSLFLLSQALREDLERAAGAGGAAVLAATRLGGAFAVASDDTGFFPGDGAIAGFVKTLAHEWPVVRAKALDVGQTAPGVVASWIVAELMADDGLIEVGYPGGKRSTLELVGAERADAALAPLDADAVLLITGGARGITAEVAVALAQAYRPRIVLVGRTPMPGAPEDEATRGITDAPSLRRAILEQQRRAGLSLEPARVEVAYRRLLREREVRDSVERLRRSATSVEYVACDVRDERAFGQVIDDVYQRYGRIDGVIHGAGVIEDKLVRDKALASFDRVFATKVDSALVLANELRPESLRFLVLFSSVSGRFGNRGQGDYAAASETINKLAQWLDRRWPGRVVAINWGPWQTTGMASPEVLRQFAERGVALIPPDVGCRRLDEELRIGIKGEVEVLIGGGSQAALPGAASASPTAEQRISMPLLAANSVVTPADDGIEVRRTLDLRQDRYLDDHRLDSRPVLPFAVALELMGEVAAAGWPELEVTEVRDIRVLRGVTLDGDQRAFRIQARPLGQAGGVTPASPSNPSSPSNSDGLTVDVTITSDGEPAQLHYRSVVELRSRGSAAVEIPDFLAAAEQTLKDAGPLPLSLADAYRSWLFHGPTFQGIVSVEAIGPHGARSVLRPSVPADCLAETAGDWLIDPVMVDSAFQMQVIWARLHWDVTLLPAGVKAYRRIAKATPGPIRHEMRVRPESQAPVCRIDHDFYDVSGRLIGRLVDVEGVGSKALNRLAGGVSA